MGSQSVGIGQKTSCNFITALLSQSRAYVLQYSVKASHFLPFIHIIINQKFRKINYVPTSLFIRISIAQYQHTSSKLASLSQGWTVLFGKLRSTLHLESHYVEH